MRLTVERILGAAAWVPPPSLEHLPFGVPRGGPFDAISADAARALLDLPPSCPVIELALGSITLVCLEAGWIAVTGAPASLSLDNVPGRTQCAFPIQVASRLVIGPPRTGARIVIAIGEPDALTPLAPGAEIASQASQPGGHTALGSAPASLRPGPIAIVPRMDGPWLGAEWTVQIASDRRGVRLRADLAGGPTENELSEPCWPGAVQWTPSGELIVVGPDGPTIGGYPVVGTVPEAELSRIGQLAPGSIVHWMPVDWAD